MYFRMGSSMVIFLCTSVPGGERPSDYPQYGLASTCLQLGACAFLERPSYRRTLGAIVKVISEHEKSTCSAVF